MESRRPYLALADVILTASHLGFLAAVSLAPDWAAPAVAVVSVVCTLGEIIYAGTATALVTALAPPHALGRALARFELSMGLGLAVSPAVITTLTPHGPAPLWGSLATATLLSASAVATEKDRGTRVRGSGRRVRAGARGRLGCDRCVSWNPALWAPIRRSLAAACRSTSNTSPR